MERALKLVAASMPIVFAFAFLVPLLDQGIKALGLSAPLGGSTLVFALIIGGTWGLIAQISGRWI